MLSTASSSYQLKFEGRAAEIKKWGGKSKERERSRKRERERTKDKKERGAGTER